MAALISQVLSPNVSTDLESLIKTLGTIEKHFDTINTKGIGIGNIGTIAEYTALVKKQDDTIKELTKTIDKYKQVSAAVNQAVRDDSERTTRKRIADDEKAAKQLIAEAQRIQNARRKELEKEQADSDKTAQKVLANELKKREAADLYIRKIQEKADKLQKAAEKEAATLAKQNEAYALLSKEYNEAAKAAQNLGAQQYRLSQNVNNGVDVQFNTSEMVRLAPALALAKDKANGLHKALLEIDQTVGRSQRNVGNYNSATFAMSQILREAPSFAYSFSQGLLGISNNIPILVDEITRLKTANVELMAQGKATVPIWKQLAAAFTSPVGIITVATAAITIFAARMSMASKETKNATDRLNEYEEQLKSVAKAQKDLSSATEAAILLGRQELETLVSQLIYAKSIEAKTEAYNKLKEAMPGVLRGYTQEEVLAGKANDAIFKHTEQINKLKAEIKELQPVYERQVQLFEKTREKVNQLKSQFGSKWQDADKTTAKNLVQQLDDMVNSGIRLDEMKRQLAEFTAPDLPKEKKTHPEKDAKKDMEAEIKLEQELFERDKIIIQKKYDQSRKTFAEEKAMQESLKQSAMVHYDNMIAIVDKYHGKVGEKEELYKARKIQAENDRLAVENATNEAERKIAEEVQKRHIEEGKRIDEQIDKLQKLRAEVEKVNREIETIQAKAAAKKEYASGFSPYLQALGFDGSFSQGINQRNTEIEGKRGNIMEIQSSRADEKSKGSGADLTKLLAFDKQIADERKGIAELEAANEDALNQRIIKGKEELARRTIELAREAFDVVKGMQLAAFEAEEKQLNFRSETVKRSFDDRVRAIQVETATEEEKNAKIKDLNANRQSQEEKIAEEKKQLNIKRARFEKEMAMAQIIADGAVGVAKIWSEFAAAPVIAAALTAIEVAAIGAQLAKASSVPIPTYAEGTENHPGGLAIIGDGGEPEHVTTPTGKSFWSESTPTLINLPKGSSVTPLSAIEFAKRNMFSYSNATVTEKPQFDPTPQNKEIIEKLDELVYATHLNRAIVNIKTTDTGLSARISRA